jgi:L-amino acid N-acyltransferase YncA
MIRPAKPSDAGALCGIYNHYILHTRITFEEEPLADIEMRDRITTITRTFPWLVYEENGTVIGYTYASKWKERSAYRYSVEAAIYLDVHHLKKGIGTKLTEELLKQLKTRSLHSVLCGIALPNPASIALYEKFGFQKVAHLKEVGFKMDKWIDVGYWELLLR